jgi:hypothetical protein
LGEEDGGTIIACRILIKELLGKKTTSTLKRVQLRQFQASEPFPKKNKIK